jgi:hypothetical protein
VVNTRDVVWEIRQRATEHLESVTPGVTGILSRVSRALIEAIAEGVAQAIDLHCAALRFDDYKPTRGFGALDPNDIYNRLTLAYAGQSMNQVLHGLVKLLCEDIEKRLSPLIEALQLVGNQVHDHNQALQAMTEPEVPKPTHWDCYCGFRNLVGKACTVCDRRPGNL